MRLLGMRTLVRKENTAVAFATDRGPKPPTAAVQIRIEQVHALTPGATAGARIA